MTPSGGDVDLLRHFPNEVFECILSHLDLKSIQSVRLTSISNADRCLGPTFKRYFARQETDLTIRSLERLWHLTAHPKLGPAIRCICVTAVCHDPSVWDRHSVISSRIPNQPLNQLVMPQIRKLTKLRHELLQQPIDDIVVCLAQIFKHMGSLHTLRLHARVVQSVGDVKFLPAARPHLKDWVTLWADCSRVLKIATIAMAHSGVNVDTLLIFDDCLGKVSSVEFSRLVPILHHQQKFVPAAANLKNLTLAFSTRTHTPMSLSEHEEGSADNDRMSIRPRLMDAASLCASDPTNFPGVAEFLKMTPNLEGLTLHMYNTLAGIPVTYEQIFDIISKDIRLPKLRRLTLRGIRTTSDAILTFLRNHPGIVELDLRGVHLSGPCSGWFRIFRHLQQRLPGLDKLRLENIWHGHGRLLSLQPKNDAFDDGKRGPGHSFMPRVGPHVVIYARNISSQELKEGLEFVAPTSSTRGKGDGNLMYWLQQRRTVYGPPFT